jgi:hypothetical protein
MVKYNPVNNIHIKSNYKKRIIFRLRAIIKTRIRGNYYTAMEI